jgi:DNA-directed RNA polymerase specialized sigma subunit
MTDLKTLIEAARAGSTDARHTIIERFRPLTRKFTRKYARRLGEDAEAVALLGLVRGVDSALRSFDGTLPC